MNQIGVIQAQFFDDIVEFILCLHIDFKLQIGDADGTRDVDGAGQALEVGNECLQAFSRRLV